MKSLVIGNTGQVGWELERLLKGTDVVALDYPTIDLTRTAELRERVLDIRPRVIFNAAAYTAVDKAESEPEVARRINAEAPAVLARAAREIGAGFVHYSTDYVYDGTKDGLYVESDPVRPQSVYGRTKAEGDSAVVENAGEYAILRTSWVYGGRGKNFLLTMLRLAGEKPELKIVDDQVGSPTWCRSLAEASITAARQMLEGSWNSGIYHATNSGFTSWFGFATEIFRQREILTGLKGPTLTPIGSDQFPLPAPRPKNSRLSSERFARQFGAPMIPWQEAVSLVMKELPPDTLR